MSFTSKRHRRRKRRAVRAAWTAIGDRGAFVAPDVWERIRAMTQPGPTPDGFGAFASIWPSGIPIEVCSFLEPGTIMPRPRVARLGLDWPLGTFVEYAPPPLPPLSIGFWPTVGRGAK